MNSMHDMYLIQKKDMVEALETWQQEYNQDRPHGALNGQTPKEALDQKIQELQNERRDVKV